jgi:hypothetical protein
VLAVVAALAGVAGAVALIVSVAALGHPWTSGYVSEAGVGPRSGAYRLGILALSVALLLLGGAVQRLIAGGLLVAAGAFGTVSAAVTCTPGCPLPPYQHSTAQDLVHATASCLSVGLTALAMAAIGTRASRWMFAITAALLAALGITLLAIGRSTTTAVLERLVLTVLVAWAVATAVGIAARARPPGSRDG